MVKEGIVLGHKISKKGIEVDKDKIKVIEKLLLPIFVKGILFSWVMQVSIRILLRTSLKLLICCANC